MSFKLRLFELVLDSRSYFVVLFFTGLGSVGGGTVRVGRVARVARARVRFWLDSAVLERSRFLN